MPTVDVYARLSKNPDGDLEKIDTQIDDCRAVAARNGWNIGSVFYDDDLSAWRRTVNRPGWQQMLSRVEKRETDGIVVWNTDRLLRQPSDLEKLIEFGEKDGFIVASAQGEYDLQNSDHRMTLRIGASMAEKSSADTSRRTRRRFMAQRADGVAQNGGHRRMGYRNSKSDDVPDERIELERRLIREAIDDVIDGKTIASIARRWNEAGITAPRSGKPVTGTTIWQVLRRPRNAGLIEHLGEIVSRNADIAIVDEDKWNQMMAVFAGRKRGRPLNHDSLLTGLIYCGHCGHHLTNHKIKRKYRKDEPPVEQTQYGCNKSSGGCSKVAVIAHYVEDIVIDFVVARLSDPDNADRFEEADSDGGAAIAELKERAEKIRTRRSQLVEKYSDEDEDWDEFLLYDKRYKVQLKKIGEEIEALTGAVDVEKEKARDVKVGESEVKVRARWDESDRDGKRAMIRRGLKGWRVDVYPTTRIGPFFDRERVKITPLAG